MVGNDSFGCWFPLKSAEKTIKKFHVSVAETDNFSIWERSHRLIGIQATPGLTSPTGQDVTDKGGGPGSILNHKLITYEKNL